MTACDHPLDGHANHGPWCESEPGPWRNPCPVCGAPQPPCGPECGFKPTDEDLPLPLKGAGHPILDLVIARQRLTRAVLATLIGPTDLTSSYGGSEKAAADYAEMAEAARELVFAQENYDEAVQRRYREHGGVKP